MKKYVKFLSFVLILAMVIGFTQFNVLTGKAQSNISIDEAKTFTTNYFAQRTQSILNDNKLDIYISSKNPNLKDFEAKRSSFYRDLVKSWGGNLISIESQPDIRSITVDEQSGNINEEVYEWITIKWHSKKVQIPKNFEDLKEVKELRELEKNNPGLKEAVEDKIQYIKKGYTDYPEIVDTGIGVTHEIVLSRENGKIVILKDAYDEGPDLTVSPDFIFNKQNTFPIAKTPIQIGNIKQINATSSISYYYDRQEGADYADQYVPHFAGDPDHQYNPCYKNFNPPYGGGDCANYVSQCLFAAGQPRIFDDGTYPTGQNPWYYKNRGTCDTSDDKWNSAWTYAPTLYNTVIASNRGRDESYSLVTMGDIAFWNGDSYHCHVVFVVQDGNSSNPPLYDAHNNDRWHYPLYNSSYWSYVWIYGGTQSIAY